MIDKMTALFIKIAKLRSPLMREDGKIEYVSLLGNYWKAGDIADPIKLQEKITIVEDAINDFLKDKQFPQRLKVFEEKVRNNEKLKGPYHVPYHTYISWEKGLSFQEWIVNHPSRETKLTEDELSQLINIKQKESLEFWKSASVEYKTALNELKQLADLYLSTHEIRMLTF